MLSIEIDVEITVNLREEGDGVVEDISVVSITPKCLKKQRIIVELCKN